MMLLECHQLRLHPCLRLVGTCCTLLFLLNAVNVGAVMTMTRTAPTTAASSLLLLQLLLPWPSILGNDMQRRKEARRSLLFATAAAATSSDHERDEHDKVCEDDDDDIADDEDDVYEDDIVLIKLGGSSLTNKAVKESLNNEELEWFAKTLALSISSDFMAPPAAAAQDEKKEVEENECKSNNNNSKPQRRKRRTSSSSFIVVHGAGSFGHHQANQFGLQKNGGTPNNTSTKASDHHHQQRHQMQGLAQTRLSVQTLNRLVVAALIENNVNAVGISPCFSRTPSMTIPPTTSAAAASAHDDDDDRMTSTAAAAKQQQQQLVAVVQSTLQAGLVPVLHGDACLFYNDNSYGGVVGGILSGDTIIEWLGSTPWVSRVIFLTDVDGVYTSDPRLESTAEFVPLVAVSSSSSSSTHDEQQLQQQQHVVIQATGSTHAHDVTGGFTTKLASAIAVAQTGKNVTIVKCGSMSAVQIISQNHHDYHDVDDDDDDVDKQPTRATVVYAPRGVVRK